MSSQFDVMPSRAVTYAEKAAENGNGRFGKYVVRQAEKWLEIVRGENSEARIDEKAFAKITKILKVISHPDLGVSMYDGLEDYAMLFIYAVLCTKHRKTGNRYYHTGLLEIGRKNFKTFISAVIFVIEMLTEPRFSRFFSVAPDLKLSKELQIAISKIIKSNRELNDGKVFKALRSEIRCIVTDSEYTPLAYSNDKMDGKLATTFLADEAGAMDSYPIEAMRSSQIILPNKLGIIISTQYPNDNNAMIDEIDIAKKSLDGLNDIHDVFALIFEPDEEIRSEWDTNDNVIYQSNPVAHHMEIMLDDLRNKRSIAIDYENKRENFLCKHCNIRYKSLGVEGYVDVNDLRKCKRDIPPDFWRGKRVYAGLDLSQTDDNTSVSVVCYEDGIIYAMSWAFVPAERVDQKSVKEKLDYRKMIASGYCMPCGEEIIDYAFVEDFILSLEHQYGFDVVQLGYDRYNALSSIQKIESAPNPIECVEIKQHSSVLHPATKLLYESIVSQKFAYSDNLLYEINFENARCTEDTNKNKYVNKKKSSGKVDMVVSTINAVSLLIVNEILNNESNWAIQC
jgi:phage terminase large subunit-like protein